MAENVHPLIPDPENEAIYCKEDRFNFHLWMAIQLAKDIDIPFSATYMDDDGPFHYNSGVSNE